MGSKTVEEAYLFPVATAPKTGQQMPAERQPLGEVQVTILHVGQEARRPFAFER